MREGEVVVTFTKECLTGGVGYPITCVSAPDSSGNHREMDIDSQIC
jgi:hypothetical protein